MAWSRSENGRKSIALINIKLDIIGKKEGGPEIACFVGRAVDEADN